MSLTAPECLDRLEKKHDRLKDDFQDLGCHCDSLYITIEEKNDEISMLREILEDLNVVIMEEEE